MVAGALAVSGEWQAETDEPRLAGSAAPPTESGRAAWRLRALAAAGADLLRMDLPG